MGGLAALCLLLMFPPSSSQVTMQAERKMSPALPPAAPPAAPPLPPAALPAAPPLPPAAPPLPPAAPPAAPPLPPAAPPAAPPPHIRDILVQDDAARLNAKRTYAHVDKDNAKIFLFIAASVGTVALMAAVYCIYNNFYTKQQYLHMQLQDDSEGTADDLDAPGFFHGPAADSSSIHLQKSGYGSLADPPSIISVAPGLPPPPAAMRFPPRFLSSRSLRTISAQDLEKSCI